MFTLSKIYYKLFDLLLSRLVKSKSIPINPVIELGIDPSFPIIYTLFYHSKADLLTLRSHLLVQNLPDPLDPLIIGDTKLPRYVFIHDKYCVFNYYTPKERFIKFLQTYVNLYRKNPSLDIQVIAVFVMFGRHQEREKRTASISIPMFNSIKKIFDIIRFGRNSFVCFSPFLSMRKVVTKYGEDRNITNSLIRLARIYFSRQQLALVGPNFLTRQNLFKKLLLSKEIIYAIEDEARNKKISYQEAQKHAIRLMKEISASFSYKVVRLTDRVLRLTWNRLYKGINVNNINRMYQLMNSGHAIVYVPCHRSHMDYLLLSYVLYHHGLVPPHIAAGINLNFWPIGVILRRLGAFFIRRTFKGSKLYSIVFREYLSELFSRGCSVEYFIEGGRSRTGCLLTPKTGTLSMTIQAILRNNSRPITLVPIYIGYDHVIEADTYAKELQGATKEKENLFQLLRSLGKLKNLGKGYVNFGEPIQLIAWMNQHVPGWRQHVYQTGTIRPIWLTRTASGIATDIMIRINNASSVNAMNLCCTALLASHRFVLTRNQLTEQLQCYLNLMRNVPYTDDSTIPSMSASELIDYALQIGTFDVRKVDVSDTTSDTIVIVPRNQVILMTYYRNNIIHMLILPSLIATIIIKHYPLLRMKLLHSIRILYPMLKAELFLRWNNDEVLTETNKLIDELLRQGIIILKENRIFINSFRFHTLQLLSKSSQGVLQRYAATFWVISTNSLISRDLLENKSRILTKKLSRLHNISALGLCNEKTFNTLMLVLRNEGYISNTRNPKLEKTMMVYQMLSELVSPEVRSIIESINH